MNLENGKVILDSFRVIGFKDIDKERLVQAMLRKEQESSFSVSSDVSEPSVQEVIVEPLPQVVEETPIVNDQSSLINQSNIFDQAPSFNSVSMETPVQVVQEVPNMNFANQFEDVQGGQSVVENTVLDTPQTFFDKVEQDNVQQSYVNEDPAILLIDNIRKVVEDKNQLINALNDKIRVLEEQLRISEESRKVIDAQRIAAETTLAAARGAEVNNINNGPTLTYQQQNYNQAA